MKRVITFGEIMLRLSPPGFQRFAQARSFDVVYGGAENMLVREKVVNTAARVLDIGVSQVYVTN